MIPSFIKPIASEMKFRLLRNNDEESLKNEVLSVQQQWNQIIANSTDNIEVTSSISNKLKILFVTGYGIGTHFLAVEPIIMMALYTRGHQIFSLYCNKSLPSCEFNSVGNNIPSAKNEFKKGITNSAICNLCEKCKKNIETTYENLPIELSGYNQYLNEVDYNIADQLSKEVDINNFRKFVFQNINVGEEAFASILRVTFMGEIQDTKLNRYLVQRYIMSGILTSIAYEKAFNDINPDRVVCIHGVYQTHGLAVKVAKKLNVPVIVIGGGGIRRDTVLICHNETYHHQLVNESNDVWQKFRLSEEERLKTLNYAIKKRNSGSGADYLSYHPNPIEDVGELYKLLNIDSSRKIVSLFTNVTWDAQIFYNGNAFKDIFDWLFLSISELGKNENIWIVIRIHPAESKGGLPTNQPITKEIRKRFPKLPENLRIISPESDISSYTLANESIVNIIYGTKMGLEIALLKKPLIVCGETFSRNKGYGLDIISKDQYIKVLADIHNFEVNVEEKFELALKYAHYFYFRKMVDLPFERLSTGKIGSGIKLKFETLNDLAEENNKELDMICEGILKLSNFVLS